MQNKSTYWMVVLVMLFLLVTASFDANAQVDGSDLLNKILDRYAAAANQWGAVITSHASRLFWSLVLISMVWTFGMMALRKADIGEFFAELVRFTIFTGFYWWLLINGPRFADSIILSMRMMGGQATGLSGAISPSGIMDVGFAIFDRALSRTTLWDPVDSATGLLLSGGILLTLTLVSVNMLLLLISGWVLAFAGIFFLGFGGSRWTSDIAISYYRTVFSIGTQLFVMVLLVGIGNSFLNDYYARISNQLLLNELSVIAVLCIILLALINKLPSMVSGILTGAGLNTGVGQLGAGAAMGAYGMASASASMAGSMAMQGASSAANGAQALMNAIAQGQASAGAAPNPLAGLFEDRGEQAARINAALMKSKSPDGRMSGSSGGIGGNRQAGSASGGSFNAGGQSGSNKAAALGKSISGGGSSVRGSQGVTSGSTASSGASGSGTSTGGGGAYSGSTGSASQSGFASGGSGYGGFSSGNEYLGRPPDLPEPSRHHDADIAESIAAFTNSNGSLSFEGDNYPKLPADFDYDGFFADRKSDPIAERIVRMNKPSWYYISGVDFSKFPKAPQ